MLTDEFIWQNFLITTAGPLDSCQVHFGPPVGRTHHVTRHGTAHLVRDAAVRACVPRNEVGDQPLHPAAVLGAQVLSRQTHIPVRTGSQHREEGHQVTVPIHRELCRRSRSAGDADGTGRWCVHVAESFGAIVESEDAGQ